MGCRCPCLEAAGVDEMSAARQFEYHKLSFCDDFKSKVARFFMFGRRALNKPNSAMIVGDKTSSASARVPTCSMFSD